LQLTESARLLDHAREVIPGASQTFSKGPTQFVGGVAPTFCERASGARIWDVDGNEYVDYALALGPMILGYCHPEVDEAVRRQLELGVTFTLPHRLEVELADEICRLVPCAEMVRYGKTGSDAVGAAVRIARAATGRDHILFSGYHGWHDWHIGATTRNKGVPQAIRELTSAVPYGDLAALERALSDQQPAAVVLEPIGIVEPPEGYLQGLVDLSHEHGAIVVFDEIITGFRLSLGGAQEYYGVVPDLAAFGKAVANGLPLSIVAGRRDLMREFEEIFFSTTHGGEALSLAAALATLRVIERDGVIPHIWDKGERLCAGLRSLVERHRLEANVRCIGLPPRTSVLFYDAGGADSLALKSLFQQECIKRGVLFTGSQFISSAHDDDVIDLTLAVYDEALTEVARAVANDDALERLEGTPVEAVFRRP
jgi:glutamate-1-semialdehyde 2,1-aminomutase/spore coat polysaccharide biosynthesis protein SpsF